MANAEKRHLVFNEYRKDADILCLQETHSSVKEESFWRNLWGGRIIFSHGESNVRGVCICFKKDVFFNITNIKRDMNGRFIACDIAQEDGRIVSIANIYAPNKDNPSFFDALEQNVEDLSQESIIIGDFNLVLDVEKDRYGQTWTNNNKAMQSVKEIMTEKSLIDVWRARNENTLRFSWKKHNPTLQASRIDYALISQGLDQEVENVMYFKGIKSDHDALFLSINLTKSERGAGYWKFNASHLRNSEFVEEFKQFLIKDIHVLSNLAPINKWTRLKERMTEKLKKLSKRKATEKQLLISQLKEKLCYISEQMPLNRDLMKFMKTQKQI